MTKTILVFIAFTISLATTAQTTNPAPYCVATFDDQQGFPVDDHIDRVSFGTLNNASNAQYAAPHYVFYNNLTVPNFTKGGIYKLKVNFTVAGGAGFGVWIDYNHNNIFDSTERVMGTSGTSYLTMPNAADSISLIIPATATTGSTRMRVRIVEDDNYHVAYGTKELACNPDTSAANTMDWGETEDYTINIAGTNGIGEATLDPSISLYPNPTTNNITLQTSKDMTGTAYTLTELSGRTILTGEIKGEATQIAVGDLSSGIYLLTLNGRGYKVVKE